MEIKNDTINLIKSKVLLYKNKQYFKIFKDIFINLSLKCIKNENIILEFKIKSNKLNNNKLQNISIKNYKNNSLWLNVIKNIYSKKEIKDYDIKNNNPKKENIIYQKEKEGEDNNHLCSKNQNNKYEISKLVYSYLFYLSHFILEKLYFIAKKQKTSLTNIVRIYLGLCSQNIGLLNTTSKIETNDENLSGRKKLLLKKLTLLSDYTEKNISTIKKDNNKNYNKINNEYKSNSANKTTFQINYISDLKTQLAKRYINSLNKVNKDNNKKDSKININDESNSNNINKDDDENNKNKFNTESINDDFIKGLNNLDKKNKNNSLKVLYSSSFTRLFIGETDVNSIRERYHSNADAKKEKKLEKKHKDRNMIKTRNKKSNLSLSETYLKMFLNKIRQIRKSKLPLIEKNMEGILLKFKKNQQIINKYKDVTINEDKLDENDITNVDDNNNEKNNKIFDSQFQTIRNNKDIKRNFISLSYKKLNEDNTETHEKKEQITNINTINKDIIKSVPKDNNIKTNISLNGKKYKLIHNKNFNSYRNSNNNKNEKYKETKSRIPNNFRMFKLKIKDQESIENNNKNTIHSHLMHIFRKKLTKNKINKKEINKLYFGKNLNLTNRAQRNLHDIIENNSINNKMKYFLTKKDLFFDKI